MEDDVKPWFVIVSIVLICLFFSYKKHWWPFERKTPPSAQPAWNGSFTGKGYTCGSHGCECTIKRSELEAGDLNYCSCGHMTDWHHD